MASRRSAASIAFAFLIALGALAGAASSVAAADGRTDTATSTYTLDPAHGVINVVADLTIKNQKPNTTSSYACTKFRVTQYSVTPYMSTCTDTIRYYYNSTAVWVEATATNIKVTANTGSVTVKKAKADAWFRELDISFAKLWYGQTRTLHLTYSIPGGKPRSATDTRALQAYANFCAIPHGYDSSKVTIKVPVGYAVTLSGASLTAGASGAYHTYSSGTITDPGNWWACVEGANSEGYLFQRFTAADGRGVILETWPEDPEWADAVKADILADLPALDELIDRPTPNGTALLVQESFTGQEYAGFYDDTSNTVTVDEDYKQPGLVAHELAHMWFNDTLFRDTWLSEGYAEWASREVEPAQGACKAPTVPEGTSPALSTWTYIDPRSSDTDRAVVSYEYDASCYVLTRIAAAAGVDGMARAIQALLDGSDPYAADPSATVSGDPRPATWRDWLDAVDELALDPAKAPLDLASNLILDYGVTGDREMLEARTAARTAYHQLQDTVDGWVVPAAVREPLHNWTFPEAQAAIAAALPAWTITGQADDTLAGIDARHGPVEAAWTAAATKDDLDAATALAQRQLDAAADVAAAIALADAPRDTIQEIGLIGATVPSLDPAIAAVRTIDADQAHRLAASVRDLIDQSRSAGQTRIVAAALVLAGVFVIILVIAVRRRRGRSVAVAEALAEAGMETPVDAADMSDPVA